MTDSNYSLKSVLKGASIYTIGELLTKGAGFFLIPLYTYYLSPADYGIVGYLLIINQFLSIVLMFGFNAAQTRYYYEGDKDEFREFTFSISIYLFVILFIILGSLILFGEPLYLLMDVQGIPFRPFLTISLSIIFFQLFNQLIISLHTATRNYKKTAILNFIRFLLLTISIIYFVAFKKQGALGNLYGLLVGNVLFFIIFYPQYVYKYFKPVFKWKYITYSLAYGGPLIFHMISNTINSSIDRIILEKYVSLSDLGIYSLGVQIGLAISVLIMATNSAWQPNYFKLMSSDNPNKDKENRKILYLWVIFFGFITVFGSLWSREIVIFITPQKYHTSVEIIPYIMTSYFFHGLYYFLGTPIFHFKKTIYLPFLTGFTAIIGIASNLWLIPIYGIMGSAYAMLITFIIKFIVFYIVSKRIYDPHYNIFKLTIISLYCLIGILVANSDFQNYLLISMKIIYLIAFFFLCKVVFKNEIDLKFSSFKKLLIKG